MMTSSLSSLSVQDLGFGGAAEVDAFGVAAAFDVKHSAIPPCVLVITNLSKKDKKEKE